MMNRRNFLKAAPVIPIAAAIAINPLTGDTEVRGGMWLATVSQECMTPSDICQLHEMLVKADNPKAMVVPEGVKIEWVGMG